MSGGIGGVGDRRNIPSDPGVIRNDDPAAYQRLRRDLLEAIEQSDEMNESKGAAYLEEALANLAAAYADTDPTQAIIIEVCPKCGRVTSPLSDCTCR